MDAHVYLAPCSLGVLCNITFFLLFFGVNCNITFYLLQWLICIWSYPHMDCFLFIFCYIGWFTLLLCFVAWSYDSVSVSLLDQFVYPFVGTERLPWSCCWFGSDKLSFLHSHGWTYVFFHPSCFSAVGSSLWVFYNAKKCGLDQVHLQHVYCLSGCHFVNSISLLGFCNSFSVQGCNHSRKALNKCSKSRIYSLDGGPLTQPLYNEFAALIICHPSPFCRSYLKDWMAKNST